MPRDCSGLRPRHPPDTQGVLQASNYKELTHRGSPHVRELFRRTPGNRRVGGNCTAAGTAYQETSIPEQVRDDVLLRRAAKGDEESFTLLYRRNQAALYRFALRMTGNAWAAEEIVQDVFMTMMREPKKYDPARGPVVGYLFGIARNRVLKHFDRQPREVSLEEQGADGSGITAAISTFTPAHWAEQQERNAQVRAAVLDLPAEFREAVVLCELEELSYEEAARLLECPIGTIRSRLHRGRALLLAKLEMLRSGGSRAAASVEMKLKQGSAR